MTPLLCGDRMSGGRNVIDAHQIALPTRDLELSEVLRPERLQIEDVAVGRQRIVPDAIRAHGRDDLRNAALERPGRVEAEAGPDLVETDAIVAPVGAVRIDDDVRIRHLSIDEPRNLAQRVVLRVAPDIEGLARDEADRRLQRRLDRTRDIVDVYERTPLIRPENRDGALADRLGAQKVDDEIEPRPPREAVDGGEPQAGDGEIRITERAEDHLGRDFAARVKRLRIEVRGFIHDLFARAVHRARAGKDEPFHPLSLGDLADELGRGDIDVDGQFG